MNQSNGSRRRVAVTGLGVVCPLGLTKEAFWEKLIQGQSSVQANQNPSLPLPFTSVAESFTGAIDNFGEMAAEPKKAIRKGTKMMCRETQMGVAAAQRALHDAGWVLGMWDAQRCGVSFGAGYMVTEPGDMTDGMKKCLDEREQFDFDRWGTDGMRCVTPLWLLNYLPNMPACHIAIYNDLRGPNNSLTQSEASANLAIGEAFHVIARGSADLMVTGATGTKVNPTRAVHTALQEEVARTGDDPAGVSRPFDQHRSGMVPGEGAGAVILEEWEAAKARNATIYGEVIGTGSSCVASPRHIARRKQALENAMRAALKCAGIGPDDVSFIHAHGLSTRSGDSEEAQAILSVFGPRASQLPVVAAKGNFGNLGAGSGAVELASALLALHHGHLFPLFNYQTPDPSCPVSPVKSNDRESGDCFLSLNVNHRAQASCLIVQRGKL